MMIIDKNVPIRVRDGSLLYCNVYRPLDEKPSPVIMTHGPYGKDVNFQDAFAQAWEVLKKIYPGIDTDGSSGRYLRWETPDPERWVPKGYVIINVDSRGAGESPGLLDTHSPQETLDFYDCIEWAGTQPWSNGRVGLLGISYYGIGQWKVAAMRPPHLAAICPWEGCNDPYRDQAHHGGIFSNEFGPMWWQRQIIPIQHGNASTHYFDRETSKPPTGTPLSDAELHANRIDPHVNRARHRLDDDWYAARRPALENIEVPVLSAGNWGGMGLHLRGNIEGYLGAGSKRKWLEMHGGTHYESFYLPQFIELQQRFFDFYLKGLDNGWESEPPLLLHIRHPGEKFVPRKEQEWPLDRTQWKQLFLNLENSRLEERLATRSTEFTYQGLGPGIELSTEPVTEETEITGPLVANLWVKSESTDLDLFVTVRAYDAEGKEITFRGATDPAVPIAQGWLRASHRELDPARSRPWRPYYLHTGTKDLDPRTPCRLCVEIWPTSIVLPKGFRLSIRIDGKDFEREGATTPRKGSGPFLHTDPQDRPARVFGVANTLIAGGEYDSHLLVPVIPKQ